MKWYSFLKPIAAFPHNHHCNNRSFKRGLNPVPLSIIKPGKEYWLSWGSNQQPSVLKSCSLWTRVIQKVLDLMKKGWHNRGSFSTFFNIVPLNINTLSQAMFIHYNPLTNPGPSSTPLQHGLFPNWQPGRCDLSLGTGLNLVNLEGPEAIQSQSIFRCHVYLPQTFSYCLSFCFVYFQSFIHPWPL